MPASRRPTNYGFLAGAYLDIASACQDKGIELILGGAGAWPEAIEYGNRCRSSKDLRDLLERFGLN